MTVKSPSIFKEYHDTEICELYVNVVIDSWNVGDSISYWDNEYMIIMHFEDEKSTGEFNKTKAVISVEQAQEIIKKLNLDEHNSTIFNSGKSYILPEENTELLLSIAKSINILYVLKSYGVDYDGLMEVATKQLLEGVQKHGEEFNNVYKLKSDTLLIKNQENHTPIIKIANNDFNNMLIESICDDVNNISLTIDKTKLILNAADITTSRSGQLDDVDFYNYMDQLTYRIKHIPNF